MQDILKREIKHGDLVVVKGSGRYSKGLRMGIRYNDSIRFEDLSSATYCELFKIENPIDLEKEIQTNIMTKMAEMQTNKKNIKYLRVSELKPGYIYKTAAGSKCAYFGCCKSGFLKVWSYNIDYYNPDNSWFPNPEITKTVPKFVEELGMFNQEKKIHLLTRWVKEKLISE